MDKSRKKSAVLFAGMFVVLGLWRMLSVHCRAAEKNNDGNSGSGGMYATGQSEYKDNKQEISDESYKEAGQEAVINNEPEKMIPQKYIIKDIGDGIAIYKCFSDADKEVQKFFDYALINTDNLPHDKKELLKTGIELYGEDELYEFLQAYSS